MEDPFTSRCCHVACPNDQERGEDRGLAQGSDFFFIVSASVVPGRCSRLCTTTIVTQDVFLTAETDHGASKERGCTKQQHTSLGDELTSNENRFGRQTSLRWKPTSAPTQHQSDAELKRAVNKYTAAFNCTLIAKQ